MNKLSQQFALSVLATLSLSVALLASPTSAHADEVKTSATGSATENEESSPVASKEESVHETPVLGVGLRAGLILPIGVALDVRLRPFEHITLGAMGMATNKEWMVGGDLSYELLGGGVSTPYLGASLMHYEAGGEKWAKENWSTVTLGYIWKWRLLELQAGIGVLARLSVDRAPCTGWFCGDEFVPHVLPTAEVAIRFNAL